MTSAQPTDNWIPPQGQAGLSSRLLGAIRSLRVLPYHREQRTLRGFRVYRDHVAGLAGDLLLRVGQRDYLAKGMPVRRRLQALLSHYRFEDGMFDEAYRQAVYGGRGLPLWRHEADGSTFAIRLETAARGNAEGDLALTLVADGRCLHRLSFSWLEGHLAGVDAPVVPFVACNQGRWADAGPAFDAFERVFPNNSPSFFCFAAMQGIALALGMQALVAVRAEAHVAYDPDPQQHFANAYDGFWHILGGAPMPGRDGYLIALPFYVKPLADMPSKHRKRAAQRRDNWRQIGDAACAVVRQHVLPARTHVEQPEAVAEPA